MWQTITAIAVPIILGLGGFFGSGGTRLSKRIHHHADLLDKVKDSPVAFSAVSALLEKEVRWLDEKESARQVRKINWPRVALAAGVAASSTSLSALTLHLAFEINEADAGWGGFAIGAAGAVTAISVFVTGTYLARIFEPTPAAMEAQLIREARELQRRDA